MPATTMGVKLDDDTRARLKKLGALKRRSSHWLMREAIRQFLEAEERYERQKAEDEARWQRYLETGAAIPHAAANARLDVLAGKAAEKARAG